MLKIAPKPYTKSGGYHCAEDGANFVIAQAFEPQQDDTSVHKTKSIDSLVEAFDLQGFLIIVLIGFDIHIEVHSLSSPLLLLVIIETEVEADAVDPRPDVTFPQRNRIPARV